MGRSSCGGYTGAGTLVSGRDPSWFSPGSTSSGSWRDDVGQPPPRPPDEQRAYEAFVRSRAAPAPSNLIPKAEYERMVKERHMRGREARRRMEAMLRPSQRKK
jgi:hypothetical protein